MLGDRTASAPGETIPGSDVLVEQLYRELHSIARREHRRGGGPMTLQPTALIGEAYLKLRGRGDWTSETHFLGHAATAMRHVMVDAARARMAAKRSGQRESLTEALATLGAPDPDAELVRLADALGALAKHDPQLAKVVEYRFFVGLDERDTAQAMGVSDRTIRRWWTRARAWIHCEMAPPD